MTKLNLQSIASSNASFDQHIHYLMMFLFTVFLLFVYVWFVFIPSKSTHCREPVNNVRVRYRWLCSVSECDSKYRIYSIDVYIICICITYSTKLIVLVQYTSYNIYLLLLNEKEYQTLLPISNDFLIIRPSSDHKSNEDKETSNN